LSSSISGSRCEGFVSDVLSGPMQQFYKQFPGIKVNLDLAGTNEVMRKITEDEGEIGLVYNPPPEPKIVSRASAMQPLMAIVGPGFPRVAREKPMTVQELASFPLAATHASYGTRQMLQAVEFAEKIRLDPVVTTNSIAILKQFVKSGLGIACLPAFSVSTELDAGDSSPSPSTIPCSRTRKVTRVGRKLSVASNKLLQLMHSQMRAFR
jgi:DNA-binding transcriptional LysR family regulator